MPPLDSIRYLSRVQAEVVRTLLYFGIFRHPLRGKEVHLLLQKKNCTESEVSLALHELVENKILHFEEGFYLTSRENNPVRKRLAGEIAAKKGLQTAIRYSGLIARFPFIRSISLSGSLSKNYMDKDSDIDYFIVTSPKRMWVARTFLVLFKKIFLLNSRKYFCVNYFISEDNLEVPDKNIFTATEIAFIIPTYNHELYSRFMLANEWVGDFLPNFPLRSDNNTLRTERNFIKGILEKTLSGTFGEKLDTFCFRLTLRYWKKKFRHFDENTFDIRLRSKTNVSKHHPHGFQEKVLKKYVLSISDFEKEHNIVLHAEDPVYS